MTEYHQFEYTKRGTPQFITTHNKEIIIFKYINGIIVTVYRFTPTGTLFKSWLMEYWQLHLEEYPECFKEIPFDINEFIIDAI